MNSFRVLISRGLRRLRFLTLTGSLQLSNSDLAMKKSIYVADI